jgi:hypothetical protein
MISFVRPFFELLGLASKMALKASSDVSLGSPDVALMAIGRWIE